MGQGLIFKDLSTRHCNFSSRNTISHAHSSRSTGPKVQGSTSVDTILHDIVSRNFSCIPRPTAGSQKPFGSYSLSLLGWVERHLPQSSKSKKKISSQSKQAFRAGTTASITNDRCSYPNTRGKWNIQVTFKTTSAFPSCAQTPQLLQISLGISIPAPK